jgi:hypothetical protein
MADDEDRYRWFAHRLMNSSGLGQQLLSSKGFSIGKGSRSRPCVKVMASAVVLGVLKDERVPGASGLPLSAERHARLFLGLLPDQTVELEGCHAKVPEQGEDLVPCTCPGLTGNGGLRPACRGEKA